MATFTIIIGDSKKRMSVKGLAAALQKALELLHSLELDISGSTKDGVRWEIAHISSDSPITIEFSPKAKTKEKQSVARDVVKACVRGFGEMEHKSNPKAPPHFSLDSLTSAKELLQIADNEGLPVAIQPTKNKLIKLTNQTARHIDKLVSKARTYNDVLTIEGRLEMLSVYKHPSFFIWESLTSNRIECFVNKSELGRFKDLLGLRVAVTGEVHYLEHIPKTIRVESVRVLRDKKDLPQPSTMKPINLTDGLSSEEHVRGMRDG